MFNVWLHIVALIAYLGAIVGLGIILLPSISSVEDHQEKVRFLARGLKFYNPLQVGALGLVLFSGAFELTHLKAIYREMFLKQLGYSLGLKLTFAFLLVFFSVYQAMGIGHRFVKRHELGESVTPDQLASVIRRLKGANWFILILALITLWLGLRLQA
jgi:uncharacterized membrane protein